MAGDITKQGAYGGYNKEQSVSLNTDALKELTEMLRNTAAESIDLENTLTEMEIKRLDLIGGMNKKQQKELFDQRLEALNTLVDKEYELREKQEQEAYKRKLEELNASTDKNKNALIAAEDEAHKKRLENLDKEKKQRQKINKQLTEEESKAALKAYKERIKKQIEEETKALTSAGSTIGERIDAAKSLSRRKVVDENGNEKEVKSNALLLDSLTSALSDFAKSLDKTIDDIASKKGAIDTRLQGSKNKTKLGSYWDRMSQDITGIAGASPLIKQKDIVSRVEQMVSQGIAFNIEQRATLDVMKNKIATTFDATNATLLRLVRIQQQDTTAGRLGMESALTAFLNNMYETTEYMKQVSDSVKSSLEDAMSLMSGENALSFEYQVQKWLGSMYSVGMSNNSVNTLASVLGQVASGKLEAISGSGAGNLVVMAANNAGMSVGDILANGLDASNTNALMTSMVDYLAKIYKQAGDNKVLQQQFAQIYGLTASDLRAISNLSSSVGSVSRDGLTYSGALARLNSMAGSMYARSSMGEMLTNAFDNIKYSMSAGIANNPALYGLYKVSNMLDSLVGGIALPDIKVMGTGVNLQTTVADLMRVAALSGGIFNSMGAMVSAGGGGGITGNAILKAIGVGNGISTVSRGTGAGLSTAGGVTVSESGQYVGNGSGSDIQGKTLADASDSANSQLVEATDESEETKLSQVDSHVVDIYELLRSIAEGNYTLRVSMSESGIWGGGL